MSIKLSKGSKFYNTSREVAVYIRVFENKKNRNIISEIYKREECSAKYISEYLNIGLDEVDQRLKMIKSKKLITSSHGCYKINFTEFKRIHTLMSGIVKNANSNKLLLSIYQ